MQSTLLMVLMLLSSQVADPTGERYPQQPITAPASELGTETEAAPSGEEPAVSNDNFFDSIDAEAQPLTTPSQSTFDQNPAAPAQDATVETPPHTMTPAETRAPESETDPAKLLTSFLEAPVESPLKGMPLTLADAIKNSLSRLEQTQRVAAYWELSQAAANYYLAHKERTELAALRQGILQPSAEWEASRQATEARLQLALERVRVAQQYLAQLMANSTPGFSPLPSDVPYCGIYETRYAQIFQNRPSPLAQQLNELLPRAFRDLSTRAQEIADARQWMFKVSDTRGPQTDGNELLKAYELFAARRRMFLGAVKEYNLAILRYTEIATPGTLETERLVAMLIRTGSAPGNTWDTEVQKANAEEGVNTNESSRTRPTTPGVEGWNAVPQNNAEHSILVPRS